jgi:hypothetical protein
MDFNDNQGKLEKKYLELFCLFIYLDLFICKELTLAFRHPWLKNIFLSQYLFIAILCVKMSRVTKALVISILILNISTAQRRNRRQCWTPHRKEMFLVHETSL